MGIPEDAALAGAERLTRSLALRLPELFREKETVGISGASASEWEQAAMLSHEFKTPLTVVLSSLQLLRRRLCRPGKDIADGVEKYLDYAEQNLYKTLRLAANILDAQYADVKNVQTEEYTDLAAALAETVEGARPYAQACGVTLRFENRSKGPCGLLCDTQRLDRIVLNLLSNALKHTPGGGAVFVLLERDGLYARIVVEDDGCGIPEQALPHLFEKFWRGQGERGGSGLGLYIAQQFARMQGGRNSCGEPDGARCAFYRRAAGTSAWGGDRCAFQCAAAIQRRFPRNDASHRACRTAACAKVYLTALLYR